MKLNPKNTDFLDKASIIRLTISFLKLRQFSVNGHPPWAPDFTTLGSANPYSNNAFGSQLRSPSNGCELAASRSETGSNCASPAVDLARGASTGGSKLAPGHLGPTFQHQQGHCIDLYSRVGPAQPAPFGAGSLFEHSGSMIDKGTSLIKNSKCLRATFYKISIVFVSAFTRAN